MNLHGICISLSDLFHLAYSPQDLSLSLQMTELHPFLWLNICMYVCICIYVCVCVYTFVHIKCTCEYRYLLEKLISPSPHFTFTSFRNGVAGYMVILFFIFLRNFHAIYQSGHTNLHSHQNTPGIPFIHIITFFFVFWNNLYERCFKIIVR